MHCMSTIRPVVPAAALKFAATQNQIEFVENADRHFGTLHGWYMFARS